MVKLSGRVLSVLDNMFENKKSETLFQELIKNNIKLSLAEYDVLKQEMIEKNKTPKQIISEYKNNGEVKIASAKNNNSMAVFSQLLQSINIKRLSNLNVKSALIVLYDFVFVDSLSKIPFAF